jgi:hypothetical protein
MQEKFVTHFYFGGWLEFSGLSATSLLNAMAYAHRV